MDLHFTSYWRTDSGETD